MYTLQFRGQPRQFRAVPAMFGLGNLSRAQRLILGIFVLLLVDMIWVASFEITEYLFKGQHFGKPYFSTYLKTSMFILYLTGFLIWRSWRLQCRKNNGQLVQKVEDDKVSSEDLLSEPIYVPVKFLDRRSSHSGTDSDEPSVKQCRSVRFSNLSEVRQLTEVHAEEAVLARLSYAAYVRAEEARLKVASKLSVKQIAKLAAIFCVVFFFANLSYQEAMSDSKTGMAKVLSSTSGLFTLVLAAVFPSSTGDRFTLSKFVAVVVSIGGVVLVSLSENMEVEVPLGALWALLGSLLYAIYLVMVRRRVDNEEKLNIPMFFGFVGFFTMIFLWPGLLIVHFSRAEDFHWPDSMQWLFLLVNGLIGTVLSDLLWLWGCFLTSSLVATLSLSLTIPMTMIADIVIKQDVSYNWMFYLGAVPVFIAFFAVTILCFYDNWDPVLLAVKKVTQCLCRRRFLPRLRELDREQTESLIGINTDRLDT